MHATDPAPTPWFSVVHPLTQRAYKLRLERPRRNGKITVQFAKDCPTAPAKTRAVLPSRPYWYDWVSAAERLLSTSVWDLRFNPETAACRPMWNEHHRDYATHHQDLDAILFELPRLLDPKSGRPSRVERELAQTAAATHGGTKLSGVQARMHRKQEMLMALRTIATAIKPIRDRMQDQRRMRGYTADQINQLQPLFETIFETTERLRRLVHADNFAGNSASPPGDRQEQFSKSTSAGLGHAVQTVLPVFALNLDDEMPQPRNVPLSAQEKSIGQELAFQEREAAQFHPGTNWLTPEAQRAQGWSEEDIAQSQRVGRERGVIKGFSFGSE